MAAVMGRCSGPLNRIGIGLTLALEGEARADYALEIAGKPTEGFRVAHERCIVQPPTGPAYRFEIGNGEFSQPIPRLRPRVAPDRLALYAASATEEFRPVFDFLTSMHSYAIVPERLRELQKPDSAQFLESDGGNAAAVLKRVQEQQWGNNHQRLCYLLSLIAEDIIGVEHQSVGPMETIRFIQDVGSEHPWHFDAVNMSDGILRMLGLLLAAYQPGEVSVLAIEEPEATIHPAAAEVVIEVLIHAANKRQVLISTHSPDLLDFKELTDQQLRVVTKQQGRTLIAPVSSVGAAAIRERVFTSGKLLREDELEADPESARKAAEEVAIFGLPPVIEKVDEAGDHADLLYFQ